MICRHCRKNPQQSPKALEYITDPNELSFGKWLIHQIGHVGDRLNLDTHPLFWVVIRFPILDAENDGEELFWRWDPWNGIIRAKFKRLQAEGKIPPGEPTLGVWNALGRLGRRLRTRAESSLKTLGRVGRGPRG